MMKTAIALLVSTFVSLPSFANRPLDKKMSESEMDLVAAEMGQFLSVEKATVLSSIQSCTLFEVGPVNEGQGYYLTCQFTPFSEMPAKAVFNTTVNDLKVTAVKLGSIQNAKDPRTY